jgi:hypothetical protein
MHPGLLLRYLLRPVFWLARLADFLDRTLFTGSTRTLSRLPSALGQGLARVQSGSLTEYLLLIFTGLALLVAARLFA